jgi:O-antigen ligase
MFDKLKKISLVIPFFMISVILITETKIEDHLHHKCYDTIISLISLITLLCLVKHGKLSKFTAIILSSILFIMLYIAKCKITGPPL